MSDPTTERRFDAIFERLGELSGKLVDYERFLIQLQEKMIRHLARHNVEDRD